MGHQRSSSLREVMCAVLGLGPACLLYLISLALMNILWTQKLLVKKRQLNSSFSPLYLLHQCE